MNKKQWDSYVTYLDIIQRKTNRVNRDSPYEEYYQFPDGREDLRDTIDKNMAFEKLWSVLETLTDRERKILILRFGLDDGIPKSLDQVGEIFCVQRERVRQIEFKALRKMRHPHRIKLLMEPEQHAKWLKKKAEQAKQEELELEERELARKKAHEEWWEREGKQEKLARLEAQKQIEIEREKRRLENRAFLTQRTAEQLALAEEKRLQALKWVEERDKAIEQRNKAQQVQDNRGYRWDAIRKIRIYDE